MSPQANLEHVLAACQAMGAKMILPMMASRVHRMVILENLPLARLYTVMQQLNIYHAKATKVQVPSMLQVANSWWVNGHSPCTTGYSMWPLWDMVLEAEAFFLLDLVCSLIHVVLDTKALPRLLIERSPFYPPLGIPPTRPCQMHGTSVTISCRAWTMPSNIIWR